MSIAIDLPRKRIYIRGDIYKAYRWITRRFDESDFRVYEKPFQIVHEDKLMVDSRWTIEHNPEPL